MALDTPRTTDVLHIPAADQIATAEQRLRPRTALLALAADLDDVGVRSRLVDDTSAVLRCWDANRQGKSIQVACVTGTDGRLEFRDHPSGQSLGDAETVLQPGQASDIAHVIADSVGV